MCNFVRFFASFCRFFCNFSFFLHSFLTFFSFFRLLLRFFDVFSPLSTHRYCDEKSYQTRKYGIGNLSFFQNFLTALSTICYANSSAAYWVFFRTKCASSSNYREALFPLPPYKNVGVSFNDYKSQTTNHQP